MPSMLVVANSAMVGVKTLGYLPSRPTKGRTNVRNTTARVSGVHGSMSRARKKWVSSAKFPYQMTSNWLNVR